MKHERTFNRRCLCSDCDGTGKVERGRRGPNDPEVVIETCDECYGTGEVVVSALDSEDIDDV